MKKNYLITGVTGFVGSSLCVELLKEDSTSKIYVIVRSKGRSTVEKRVEKALSPFFEDFSWKEKVVVLEGDITKKYLGLSHKDYEELCKNINIIYHSAASISFALPYEEAKLINCTSTENIVELIRNMKRQQFERLNYISTAYIAGSIVKGFSEQDLSLGQEFANTYGKTKYEAECYLDQLKQEIPITIFRPSFIGSHSKSGYIHKNSFLFKLISLFDRNKIKVMICDEEFNINVVPIDYFIEGMLALAKMPSSIGKRYHLVNNNNVCVRDYFSGMCQCLKVEPPIFLAEKEVEQEDTSMFRYIFHYCKASHQFRNEETKKALHHTNIICQEVTPDYISKNIQFYQNNYK